MTAGRNTWTIPLFENRPWAPVGIWLSIAGAWVALFVIYARAVTGIEPWDDRLWKTWGLAAVQTALLLGYLVAALVWARRRTLGLLRVLRPELLCSDSEFETLQQDVSAHDARHLFVVAALGAIAGLALLAGGVAWLLSEGMDSFFDDLGFTAETGARFVRQALPWEAAGYALQGALLALFFYVGGGFAMRVSRVGAEWTRVDLVDLDPLRPFVEHGLGGVIALMVLAALLGFALLVFPTPDQVFGVADPDVPVLIGSIVILPIAAIVALFAPLRGVRDRVEEAKRTQLESIRAEMREVRAAGSSVSQGRLADLVAYEGRIEATNTWLFDRSVLLRFALILGAGMSMVLGALVERAVDAALG